ncbi:hypothetical protein DFS34DRAFT_688094 [Phlyctochytrium arcticum]|nr:hypothetical protein DFS34DRAFT_688094 [Phlyctochytrium arcticum]
MASLEHDYYALLEIKYDATTQDIRKAYRKTALKYHPDKVGAEDKKAAEMYHLLNLASDTLSDDTKRAAYDALYKSRIAQKRKLDAMDSHLRQARESLNAREASAKRSKDEAFMAQVHRKNEIDRIREEGQRKVQAVEEQRRQMFTAKRDAALREAAQTAIEEMASVTDCTLRVKWKRKIKDISVEDLERLFSKYGKIDKVISSAKGKALVVFLSVLDTHAAMQDTSFFESHGIQCSWAGGAEPEYLKGWSATTRQHGTPSATPKDASNDHPAQSTSTPGAAPATSLSHFDPNEYDDDYEMITLRRMQEAAKRTAASTES